MSSHASGTWILRFEGAGAATDPLALSRGGGRAVAVAVRAGSTIAGYIEALRRYYLYVMGAEESDNPFAEDWEQTFSLVEQGAAVHESACVHDSVVLAGGESRRGRWW